MSTFKYSPLNNVNISINLCKLKTIDPLKRIKIIDQYHYINFNLKNSLIKNIYNFKYL